MRRGLCFYGVSAVARPKCENVTRQTDFIFCPDYLPVMPDTQNWCRNEQALSFSETLARAERVVEQGLQCVARTDRRIQESLSIVRYSAFLTGVERREFKFNGKLA